MHCSHDLGGGKGGGLGGGVDKFIIFLDWEAGVITIIMLTRSSERIFSPSSILRFSGDAMIILHISEGFIFIFNMI